MFKNLHFRTTHTHTQTNDELLSNPFRMPIFLSSSETHFEFLLSW